MNQQDVNNAWDRAATVRGQDPSVWRRDEMGNIIRYGSYGTQGEYG